MRTFHKQDSRIWPVKASFIFKRFITLTKLPVTLSHGDFSQLQNRCQNEDAASWEKMQQLHRDTEGEGETGDVRGHCHQLSRSHLRKSRWDAWTACGQFLLSQTKWWPRRRQIPPSQFHSGNISMSVSSHKEGILYAQGCRRKSYMNGEYFKIHLRPET